MKHVLALLWVAIGLMLVPSAVYGQGSAAASAVPEAPASSDSAAKSDSQTSTAPQDTNAQSAPVQKPRTPHIPTPTPTPSPTPVVSSGSSGETVVGLPPPPFMEIFINLGAGITPNVSTNCPGCPVPAGFPFSAFSSFIPAAAPVAGKTAVGTGFVVETGVARGFYRTGNFTLAAEFPVVFGPNRDVSSGNLGLARSYSALFFTPALRIMYGEDRDKHPHYPPIYPWISLGGGLAHYSPSSVSLAGSASGAKSSTEGALQFGAGADFAIYRKGIALRAEVRDFYAGAPNLGVPGVNLRHNLNFSAGVVFRFCKECFSKSQQKVK